MALRSTNRVRSMNDLSQHTLLMHDVCLRFDCIFSYFYLFTLRQKHNAKTSQALVFVLLVPLLPPASSPSQFPFSFSFFFFLFILSSLNKNLIIVASFSSLFLLLF